MQSKLRATVSAIAVLGTVLVGPGVVYSQPVGPSGSGPGETHTLRPARIETVVEIDMYEYSFANPAGEMNPVIRIPAGRTVGIHLHNEGDELHEIVFGRDLGPDGEYQEILTEEVQSDLFFYWDRARVEVGGATFEEIEAPAGLRDIWMRINIPAEFAGEWELGCFLPDHYELGMHTTLIVE